MRWSISAREQRRREELALDTIHPGDQWHLAVQPWLDSILCEQASAVHRFEDWCKAWEAGA